MTTPLPDSLARFGEQLERAVERDRHTGRRRRRRIAIRMVATTAAAVAIAVGAVSLAGDDASLRPPGVATASAAERAADVLSAAPGSIVHDAATYRQVGPDDSVTTWREETWRQTSRPYARRELTTRDGVAIETATVGDRAARLYDATTNTIYTNAPDAGPAVGTPMPANDGDPRREQLVRLLRSGDARAVRRSTAGGRAVIRFAYQNALPEGGAVEWTYVVDAKTYQPMRLTTNSPDGSRVTARFETYETLEQSEETTALLSLRAQHPDAAVDRTKSGYHAAQARIYAQPAP